MPGAPNDLVVTNLTRNVTLGDHIRIADTVTSRFLGLLTRRELLPSEGLLIEPSSGVHTLGMRFAIDVLLLNREREVIAVYDSMPPFRMTRLFWKAASALELPSGVRLSTGTMVGDRLSIAPNLPEHL
ncbi:DUF192 domain-containing protein [Edaphobacter bradus]|uniref:DUF192 domain-containing protein n=1 Tax=Edaphobacter bradus TaxID=2259016 RepID=UPI0021DF7762|nr:DUF192 domain-containing protein [Edaphobacter bradus]